MKSIFLFCGILLTLCLFSKVEANCLIEGEMLPPGKHIRKCITYTCEESGSIIAIGCPAYACEKQIGYRERDVSKPFPECCEGPICQD